MEKSGKESGKRQFAIKKAYEISYAVFRIASRTGNVAFREHLERQALSLLDAAAVENYAWVNTVSRAIEYLIRFGSDVGLIHDANKELLLAELNALTVNSAGPEKSATAELVPLDDIFSGQEPLFSSVPRYSPAAFEAAMVKAASIGKEAAMETVDDVIGSGTHTGVSLSAETRQSAILQKLRQSGNCRMRDLQEILPDYSERTLRYDLQSLLEQNAIERIGSGGPSVYYRIRQ